MRRAGHDIRAYHDRLRNLRRKAVRSGIAVSGIAAPGASGCGKTPEEILEAYPYLEAEDIRAAMQYAAFLADEQVVEFAP